MTADQQANTAYSLCTAFRAHTPKH